MADFLIEDRYYTLPEVNHCCVEEQTVALSASVKKKINISRKVLDDAVKSGKVIYGVNTGFGKLSQISIPDKQINQLQRNLLLSHSAGVGDPTPEIIVKMMLLLKIISFTQGYSGVRMILVEKLVELYNSGCIPLIPCQGSVGASGDLAPLSHMSLPLIGEGEVIFKGNCRNAQDILPEIGFEFLELQYKEGLALINGTQFSTAFGLLCMVRLKNLLNIADIAGALSTEGLMGTDQPFSAIIQEVKNHPGQKASAKNLLNLLKGSEISESHKDCDRVQDMYSLRCMPQVHGACRDSLKFCEQILETEVNSVSDNPLVYSDGEVISAGNFHAEAVGQAMDIAAIAACGLGNISERRIFTLTRGEFGLPPFLVPDPGIHSGFMMGQVTAAALASENKGLAHPATVDTIPTGADQEDYVSMAPWAGRKLFQIVNNLENIFAIELLCACQAIDYREGLKPGKGTESAYNIIRSTVPELKKDRVLNLDIIKIVNLIKSGKLLESVNKKINLN